jgi:hypothetical protein
VSPSSRRQGTLNALFVWLISHQPAVLFSQNKPATVTSQQYFSLRTNQHQPSATSQTNMPLANLVRVVDVTLPLVERLPKDA